MCWRKEGRTFDFSLWIYQFLSWLHNRKTRRGDMAGEDAEIKIGTDASDDIFLLHLPLLAPSLATIVITPSSHYGPRKSQKLQLGIHISFKLWLRNKLAKYLLRYEEDATRRGAMRHCRTLCLKNHTHTFTWNFPYLPIFWRNRSEQEQQQQHYNDLCISQEYYYNISFHSQLLNKRLTVSSRKSLLTGNEDFRKSEKRNWRV